MNRASCRPGLILASLGLSLAAAVGVVILVIARTPAVEAERSPVP